MTLITQYAALSDIGLHRQANEDSYVAAPPLFVVADGMGGAEAGEVASALAVETLAERYAAGDSLVEAAQAANEAVFTRARSRVEESGMGTTLTAAVVEGEVARFAHVGDSRAYRLRDGLLESLSDDHSLVGEMVRGGTLTREEAAAHPQRSILSRALGTEQVVEVDEFTSDLRAGDVFLLCSDGLSGEVPEASLGALLAAADLDEAARGLVAAARSAGGHDNITAVVIRIEAADAGGRESTTQVLAAPADPDGGPGAEGVRDAGAGADAVADAGDTDAAGDAVADAAGAPLAPLASTASAPSRAAASGSSRRRLLLLVLVLGLIALVGLAGVVVVNTCYFVGVEDGQLAVYSGLPWSVGPLELNSVYLRSARSYALLDAGQRVLVDAEQVRTKGAALRLAEDLGMLP